MPRWVTWTASALAAALAIWAVVSVLDADLHALRDMDLKWGYFLSVIPIYLIVVASRGARIKSMTGSSKSLGMFSSVGAIHTFITKVFPFRAGEAFLPIMLKRYGVMGLLKGSGITLSIRLIDFMVLFMFLAASSLMVRQEYLSAYGPMLLAAFLGCLVVLLMVLILVVKGRDSFIGRHLPRRLDKLLGLSQPPTAHTDALSLRKIITGGFIYSIVAWACVFSSFSLLLPWAGVNGLSFGEVILGSAGAIVAGFLPINTMLSLGTLEAGWAASLYLVGVDPATGVIVGFRLHFAIFFFNVLYAIIGALALRFIHRPDPAVKSHQA